MPEYLFEYLNLHKNKNSFILSKQCCILSKRTYAWLFGPYCRYCGSSMGGFFNTKPWKKDTKINLWKKSCTQIPPSVPHKWRTGCNVVLMFHLCQVRLLYRIVYCTVKDWRVVSMATSEEIGLSSSIYTIKLNWLIV